LSTCDLVLSMYHEYMTPWYNEIYGFENWQKLRTTVVARFDESFDRPDLLLGRRWEEMRRWAQVFSFPAAQDAQKYHGQWEPFGADTTMFNAFGKEDLEISNFGLPVRKYDIGFIGSPYAIRKDYLARLGEHLPDELTFRWGQCLVQDIEGLRVQESTELMAKNYRELKIFFCLPPMSKLIVAKIPDILACGTFVMYPKLPWHARENMCQFEDKKHLVYYDPGYISQNAEQVKYYLEHEAEREQIAKQGYQHVHESYTLEKMLGRILDYALKQMGSAQAVEVGAT